MIAGHRFVCATKANMYKQSKSHSFDWPFVAFRYKGSRSDGDDGDDCGYHGDSEL